MPLCPPSSTRVAHNLSPNMRGQLIIIAAVLHIVSSFIPRNGPCIPGELVWVDCNLCTCTQRGLPNLICANMWCQPQPKAKGGTTDMPLEEEDEEGQGDENENEKPHEETNETV